MFGINGYAIAAVGVVVVGLAGLGTWQYNRANGLQEALATEKAVVQQVVAINENLNNQIDLMREIREKQQSEILSLGSKLNEKEKERNDANTKLNNYRTRIAELSQAKPGLVGRHATRAVDDLMCSFVATSGGKSDDCTGKDVPPPSTGTDIDKPKN